MKSLFMIEALAGSARGLKNSALAQRLGLDPGQVSREVRDLEAAGWVIKEDGRVKLTGKLFTLGVNQMRAEVEDVLAVAGKLEEGMGILRDLRLALAALDKHTPDSPKSHLGGNTPLPRVIYKDQAGDFWTGPPRGETPHFLTDKDEAGFSQVTASLEGRGAGEDGNGERPGSHFSNESRLEGRSCGEVRGKDAAAEEEHTPDSPLDRGDEKTPAGEIVVTPGEGTLGWTGN